MSQIGPKYVSWNLLKNWSLLSYPKQCKRCALWKETKFHNSIDTLAWRRPVDSKWRNTLVLSSCGSIGSRGINHLLKTGDRSGLHFLHSTNSICYDISLTSWNCRIPNYVILPLHCHQVSNLELVFSSENNWVQLCSIQIVLSLNLVYFYYLSGILPLFV